MDSLESVDDACTTPVIELQLYSMKVDILVLQETRLPDNESLKEEHYTFWQGKSITETREHGVGFAVSNTLLSIIEPPQDSTELVLSLHLSTTQGTVPIICVYDPTLHSAKEGKDQFYKSLDAQVSSVPKSEHIILLGYLIARVGTDHDSWPFGPLTSRPTIVTCQRHLQA